MAQTSHILIGCGVGTVDMQEPNTNIETQWVSKKMKKGLKIKSFYFKEEEIKLCHRLSILSNPFPCYCRACLFH